MLKKIKIFLFILFISGCTRQIVPISQNDGPKNDIKPIEEVLKKAEPKKTPAPILKVEQLEIVTKEIKTKPAPPPTPKVKTPIQKYCDRTNKAFKKHRWGKSSCHNIDWQYVRTSVKGQPLVWTSFGTEGSTKDVTLILCGVHGDEITPIKFCYDIIDHFKKIEAGSLKAEKVHGESVDFKDRFLVVAPMANPDSFFKKRPTRTNANGVDINRNLPTGDFKADAVRLWKSKYRSDPRRYPGLNSMSQPETVFQVNLIKRFKPLKIISVHAPLTMLDYDGPADRHTGGLVGSRANQLLIQMSEQAKGYRIKNYPFFPGSLGNYAGNERNIPTYTLELPSSNARNHGRYWKLFKKSIHHAVMHDLQAEMDIAHDSKDEGNSTKNSN